MISHRLHNVATMLRMRPDLALTIADRIGELAECVAQIEAAEVPAHLRRPVQYGDDVISLDQHRRHRA